MRILLILLLSIVVLCSAFAMEVLAAESDLIITEIMKDPFRVSDTNGEWFEIYNKGSLAYPLANLVIKDNGSDVHQINGASTLEIGAGAYFVFCRNSNSDENGGVSCGYRYSSIVLGNNEDEILLEKDGILLDRVAYSDASFPDVSGASMELSDIGDDNNSGQNWHAAYTKFGDGDYGTPGSANKPVPTPTGTVTPTPQNTPTPTKTPTPTAEPQPSQSPSATPKPTSTSKPTPTKHANKVTPAPIKQPVSNKSPLMQIDENGSVVKGPFAQEGALGKSLGGVAGSIGGVQGLDSSHGNDGMVLATDAAQAKDGTSSAPFLILGAMAFAAMVGSAMYIRRKQIKEEENPLDEAKS